MQKAAAYCRFSSDNQREESIDAQLRAIREYCDKNDYSLVKVYADEAASATTDSRKEFLRMMEDSGGSKFDVIIVHKLDRFSRNKYDSAIYKKKLKDHNIKLISVLERLDGSPESIILESMLEGMAEYFSKNLAREVMKGLKENALKCQHTGGIPPTGYDVGPNKTYVINEAEAEIVRKIFRMYLAGNGYALIAQDLNNSGQCTKRCGLFTKNSIRDILLNEKYTGVYVYNKRLSKKDNHKYKDDKEIIRIEGGIPAIVSKEDFEEVQKRILEKRRGPRMNSKRFYLLTGKIECGECGSAYVGAGYAGGRNGKRYPIYSCTGKKQHTCNNKVIRQELIENFVITELKNNVFTDEAIERITKELSIKIQERNKHHSEKLKALKDKKKDIETKLDMAFDMVFEGTMTREAYAKKAKEWELMVRDLNAEIIDKEDKNFNWVDEDTIKKFLLGSRDMLEQDDPLLKRKVVELFVSKIIIYPDYIDVDYKVDPTDSDKVGGDKGIRTPGLLNAIQARSQLRHTPMNSSLLHYNEFMGVLSTANSKLLVDFFPLSAQLPGILSVNRSCIEQEEQKRTLNFSPAL